MAFLTEKGSFTKRTTVGTDVISHSLGEAPKILILWTTAQTATGFDSNYILSIGFSDGTRDKAIGVVSEDAQSMSDTTTNRRDVRCVNILTPNGGLEAQAVISTTSTTTFTVDWLVNGGGADIIHYQLFAGSDITDFEVGDFNANTTTGNQSIPHVNSPTDGYDIYMFVSSIVPIGSVTKNGLGMGVGFATGAANEAALHVNSEHNRGTSDTWRIQREDRCITFLAPTTGVVNGQAEFVSKATTNFTINWTIAPSDDFFVIWMGIKGGQHHVNNFTEPTGTGTQDITDAGFQTKGYMLASRCKGATTTSDSENKISFGGTDGTVEGVVSTRDKDAVGTTEADTNESTADVFRIIADTGDTIIDEANHSALLSTGFRINWSNIGSAAQVFYWTFGDTTTGAALVEVINETEAISEVENHVTGQVQVVNETEAISEASNLSLRRNVNETEAISETENHLLSLIRVLNETEAVSEAINLSLRRTINETEAISEAVNLSLRRAINETEAISEAINLALRRNISETEAISEVENHLLVLIRIINETEAVNELINLALRRTINETEAISEAVNLALRRTVNETETISESENHVLGQVQVINETEAISEAENHIVTAAAIIKVINETEAISESSNLSLRRNINETESISEVENHLLSLVRVINETEVINELTNLALRRQIAEGPNITETINLTLRRNIGETEVVNESINLALRRTVNETEAISEAENHIVTPTGVALVEVINETEAISETENHVLGQAKNVNETEGITEIINTIISVVPVGKTGGTLARLKRRLRRRIPFREETEFSQMIQAKPIMIRTMETSFTGIPLLRQYLVKITDIMLRPITSTSEIITSYLLKPTIKNNVRFGVMSDPFKIVEKNLVARIKTMPVRTQYFSTRITAKDLHGMELIRKAMSMSATRSFEFRESSQEWEDVLIPKSMREGINSTKLNKLWNELTISQRKKLLDKMKLEPTLSKLEFDQLPDAVQKTFTGTSKDDLLKILGLIVGVSLLGLFLNILDAPSSKPISEIKDEPIRPFEPDKPDREPTFDMPSSFVGKVTYSPDFSTLEIELLGRVYGFCGVPERIFDAFEGTSSKGAFFNRNIKGQFDCA